MPILRVVTLVCLSMTILVRTVGAADAVSPPIGPTGSSPPVPAPPYGADQTACMPPCRPGYYCTSGRCETICNPPCPPGLECSPWGHCNPPTAVWGPAPNNAAQRTAGRAERRVEKQQRRQEAIASRLSFREVPRLLLRVHLGVHDLNDAPEQMGEDVTLSHFGVGLGFQKNVQETFGFHASAAVAGGTASVQDVADSTAPALDSTSVIAVQVEGGVHLGPFWRIYLGPSVAGTMLFPRKRELTGGASSYDVGGFRTSITADIGALLGGREQYDISLHPGLTTTGEFGFSFRFAYHFLLGAGG